MGCKDLRWRLGLGEADSAASDDREHLQACQGCRAVEAGYARLDSLLLSEPVPLLPPRARAALAQGTLQAVARRRAAEARWTRRATLLAAAAAALVLVPLLSLPAEYLPAGAGPDLGFPALGQDVSLAAALDAASSALHGTLEAWAAPARDLLQDLPARPPLVVLVLCPLLVALQWSLVRYARTPAWKGVP